MPRWTPIVLAILLGPMALLPAAAQWKWVDKNRHVQYSDLPPPAGTAEQDILRRPDTAQRRAPLIQPAAPASAASGAPALVPRSVEPELEARRRKAEQDEASVKIVEAERQAAAKAENCTRARAQLRTLDSGVRVARSNSTGEREILDDAARAAETRRTREVISADCK